MLAMINRLLRKPNGQTGFTLIELAFVVGIIALIIILVLRFYTQTRRAQDVNHATEDMTFIMAGIKDWKAGSANYNGLSLTDLYSQGRIPDDVVKNGGNYTLPSWDGCINSALTLNVNNQTVDVDFNNISSRVCLALKQRLSHEVSKLVTTNSCSAQSGAPANCSSKFSITMN